MCCCTILQTLFYEDNFIKPTYEELEQTIISLKKDQAKTQMLQNNLGETNQLLELLINTMPNPVFYKDINGIYQHCNDAFSQTILGMAKESIIGKNLFDLPDVIPFELAKIYNDKDNELLDFPGTQYYEAQVKCADNLTRDFYFNKATLINRENENIGIVGIMLDVTELRAHQKKLNEKNQFLEQLTYIDPLTQLFNRRKYDDVFTQVLNKAKRFQQIFNFIILDVDDFKQYNDVFGHYEGDQVLRHLSVTLKESLQRDEDYVFRIGGEEFALMFYTNNENDSITLIDSIKEEIEKLHITYPNLKRKITCSFGLSIYKNLQNTQKHMYQETDKLLYQAKKSGKNKVVYKINH